MSDDTSDDMSDDMSDPTPPLPSPTPPVSPPPPDNRAARKIPPIFKHRPDPHCRQCAFSLEGLPPQGKCPECGTEYDPTNTRLLLQAPSTSESALYLLVPLLCAVGATIASSFSSTGPLLFCVTVPLIPPFLGWFALRLGRFRTVMRERVLPPGAAVAPGVRSLGCAAMVLSRTILVAAIVVTVASIVFLAACLVMVLSIRSGFRS